MRRRYQEMLTGRPGWTSGSTTAKNSTGTISGASPKKSAPKGKKSVTARKPKSRVTATSAKLPKKTSKLAKTGEPKTEGVKLKSLARDILPRRRRV